MSHFKEGDQTTVFSSGQPCSGQFSLVVFGGCEQRRWKAAGVQNSSSRSAVGVLQLSSVQFSSVVCCEHGWLKKQYCWCVDSPSVALFTGPRGLGGTERHRRHVHDARGLQRLHSRLRHCNPATFPRTDAERLRPADLFAEFTDTRWHQLRRYRMGRNSE